ncbi:SDR family NAD(P)-dependent oxidoreductase [Alphaproteobacteria bacterium GH1-50]|uniref:SDR family NAD(P)-dependent oxidoreductase n=1 Tax=Kangsaoukella pontilimi TaxID=2691042 RepID=A0A7C9IUB4_9RHOB|nr:SDR family oxidoreductase [Kangsaoukella pontilimi]MXQ09645.1 SDR family NAD(P)-dependent oxidoreductase [Kangsaoukella pontilimi]
MTKTILITGASSGIGHATAEVFLDAGWIVGLVARRAEPLEALAARFDSAIALPADVTDGCAVEAVFDAFTDQAGRVDAIFNNAGIFGKPGAIDEVTVGDFSDVVDVNLTAMFAVARAAYIRMRDQSPKGGRIINNGSIAAHVPRERSANYTITKHAITGLTKAISLDGRAHDIACSQIDIGNAETQMVRDLNARLVAEGKEPNPVMDVKDAARMVLQMAELPLSANVQFATIMATKMPYIGRG